MKTDRFAEAPPRLTPRMREYTSEEQAERRERKIEADRHLLEYFFRRGKWFSEFQLGSTTLCLPFSELENLGLIERENRIKEGAGFKAGRKLYA